MPERDYSAQCSRLSLSPRLTPSWSECDMGYIRGLKFGTALTVLIVSVAIYYRNPDYVVHKRLQALLDGLERLENRHVISSRPKVTIGYGVCIDVYVNVRDLLSYSDEVGKPEHFNKINTELELLKSFAYFFRHGAAAEYMENRTLFDELVAKARSFESSYSTIGGNAAVMALRFAREGCDVTLAAKLTTSLHQMIPQVINVVGGEVKRDDIHLVIEYKHEEVWGPYTSPRANRYILHNDANNPKLSSLDAFDDFLSTHEPNLLVVSGLQLMDNYPLPIDEKKKLLQKVNKQMLQPESTKIHFEMASFTEAEVIYELFNTIIPFTDSLGMNEQEIAILYKSWYHHNGNNSFVADSMPRIATVLDQMRTLFKIVRFQNTVVGHPRYLTRLHVHTLAYQAIITVKDSKWKNTMAAAAKASLTAHRHVCATSQIDVRKATLILDESFSTSVVNGTRIPLDINKPVSCWDEMLEDLNKKIIHIEVCVAPVLVCTEVTQTAGSGDNISSASIVIQI